MRSTSILIESIRRYLRTKLRPAGKRQGQPNSLLAKKRKTNHSLSRSRLPVSPGVKRFRTRKRSKTTGLNHRQRYRRRKATMSPRHQTGLRPLLCGKYPRPPNRRSPSRSRRMLTPRTIRQNGRRRPADAALPFRTKRREATTNLRNCRRPRARTSWMARTIRQHRPLTTMRQPKSRIVPNRLRE